MVLSAFLTLIAAGTLLFYIQNQKETRKLLDIQASSLNEILATFKNSTIKQDKTEEYSVYWAMNDNAFISVYKFTSGPLQDTFDGHIHNLLQQERVFTPQEALEAYIFLENAYKNSRS